VKLYVMRHGAAEEQADSGVDGDRALTQAGRERVSDVGKALLDGGEGPLEVISSPLVRAVQTAEIVAIVTKLGERGGTVHVRREVAPGGAAPQLARQLASGGHRRVMLVGHEPDLSELVTTLLGNPLGRPFDKAMVLGVHIAVGSARARLRFLLEPNGLLLEPL
jgi:phosphohistidine phosphatase